MSNDVSGKVCVACGLAPVEPEKPMEESEDCPECGGKETVKKPESPGAAE